VLVGVEVTYVVGGSRGGGGVRRVYSSWSRSRWGTSGVFVRVGVKVSVGVFPEQDG